MRSANLPNHPIQMTAAAKNTPCRVLVIDDEAPFTRMIKLNLESAGDYQVEMVNESRKAYTATDTFQPDIVLLDVVMPEIDGGDVATLIRQHPSTAHIPIIFVSAMVSRQESGRGLYESGGEHFLAKPVTTEILDQAINQVLSEQVG